MNLRKPLNGRRCARASQVLFDALESRTLYSVPAAPSEPKLSVVSSGSQLQLNWNDNSANESGFIVYVGTSRDHMAEIARVGANVTSFKQTPPEKGVTYFAQVRAFNADGVSAGTEVIPGMLPVNPPAPPPPQPPPTPKIPAAPASLVASVVSSNTKIQLKWSDKSSNEKGFSIFRGTSRTNLVKVGSVGANVTTYTETPPAKNTTYYYNIRAFNSDGSSPATSIVSAKITVTSTPPPPPQPKIPAAPASLVASVLSSNTKIQLKWSDKSSNEKGFSIFRGTSRTNLVKVGSVGANVTAYTETPPAKNTTYYYNVRAFNSDGSSPATLIVSAKITVTSTPPPPTPPPPQPKIPAAPASLVASVVSSNTRIQLKWSDKSSNEKGFSIFRGTSKTNLVKVGSVGANVTTYTETPPAKNTTYYYNVRAFNSDGTSPATTIVSAKITTTSTPKPEPTPTPVPKPPPPPPEDGNVIHIGASRTIKTLNSAPWPAKGQTARFVLDPGSYSVKLHFIQGNLTIESANTSNRAVINLPDVFDNDGNANNPTLSVIGSLTIRNIKTSGGGDTILLGSSASGKIVAEHIQMDAGAIWRGSGARSAFFKDNEVLGRPRANVYSSYGGRVGTCVIDHSGTNVPVRQGGRLVNGNPVGETAIRIMNVDNLTLKGIKTVPWFYKPGKEWKQDVQLRPRSGTIRVIDCDFYQPDVGDMLWRNPPQTIQHVEFINCRFVKQPNVTTGVKAITFVNCKVGTRALSGTVTYS